MNKTDLDLIRAAIAWIAWARDMDMHSEVREQYLNIAIRILELILFRDEFSD